MLCAAAAAAPGRAQEAPRLPPPDRVRVVEALRLADELRAGLWPGWERTPMPVLLVTHSLEFLIGHPRPGGEFVRRADDDLAGREVWTRPARYSPGLLATFPAVGGVPTIVVGTAEHTGRASAAWVLTLLHEHFHQWQYSRPGYYAGVARLDLARGDTTGQWMLDYPFPYDSAPVQRAVQRLARALARAVDASAAAGPESLTAVLDARAALRRSLSAADYAYLEFQLWQEGVARFVEHAAARAASQLPDPPAKFRDLPDYAPYRAAADEARRALRQDLEQLALGRQRRVAFYALGAAIAELLDQTRPDWKQAYAARPFELAALLSATP